MYARCVIEALWTPQAVLDDASVEEAHALARATVLAGALERE